MENGNIQVNNTEIRSGLINNAIGEARKTEDSNRFAVSFGNSLWNYVFEGDYRIAFTDYSNYSVVYSCSNFLFFKFELAWVLGRNPNDCENSDKLEEFVVYLEKKFGFKKEELFFTKHNDQLCAVNKKVKNDI